tara:strand:- start:1660 stop:1815 length:156 start_codon:yes stop_codon:yes gene_type:complete
MEYCNLLIKYNNNGCDKSVNMETNDGVFLLTTFNNTETAENVKTAKKNTDK